ELAADSLVGNERRGRLPDVLDDHDGDVPALPAPFDAVEAHAGLCGSRSGPGGSMHELMEMPTISTSPKADPRRALLAGIFRALNSSGAPWCIVHGYEKFDEQVPADVDCLLGREL